MRAANWKDRRYTLDGIERTRVAVQHPSVALAPAVCYWYTAGSSNHSIRSPLVAGHLEGHRGFAAIGGKHDGAWTMLRPCGMDAQRGLAHGTNGTTSGRQ